MDFYQFYNKINGVPYSDPATPPPSSYNFLDYAKQLTNSPINGIEGGTYELTPLSQEDMSRYADEDVVTNINTTQLGEPLDDEAFKKYHGIG